MKLILENETFLIGENKYNCLNILKYSIDEKFDITIFLESGSLNTNFLRPNQKPEDGYLEPLFESCIDFKDFKIYNKNNLNQYLFNYLQEQDWGVFYTDFQYLLKFFNEYSENNLEECYVISKDNFQEGDEKVKDFIFGCYDFYLILIWYNKQKLYCCEWFAD